MGNCLLARITTLFIICSYSWNNQIVLAIVAISCQNPYETIMLTDLGVKNHLFQCYGIDIPQSKRCGADCIGRSGHSEFWLISSG